MIKTYGLEWDLEAILQPRSKDAQTENKVRELFSMKDGNRAMTKKSYPDPSFYGMVQIYMLKFPSICRAFFSSQENSGSTMTNNASCYAISVDPGRITKKWKRLLLRLKGMSQTNLFDDLFHV